MMKKSWVILVILLGFCWAARAEENQKKLFVYVVPHSHTDPGWWRTMEDYYAVWTKGIITSVIDGLSAVGIFIIPF
jgi:hypothetical protein